MDFNLNEGNKGAANTAEASTFNTLTNPNPIEDTNIVALATSTAANPQVLFNDNIGGTYGGKVYSISLAVDAVFQSNFYIKVEIDGVSIGTIKHPNNFHPWDATTNTFDYVKTNTNYKLQKNANITISAYNNNSGNTTNGNVSVYIVVDSNG